MKILIVDDSAQDRYLLKVNLEHRGCQVIEAANGEEGLRLAGAENPDVIISDALMPVMDGFQFLRNAKLDRTIRTIPFIFYSAVYTGFNEFELATSLGAIAFILKPKEPQAFWEELVAVLEKCRTKNEMSVSEKLLGEEEEFLKKYSHIVAKKLEQKVRELEAANALVEDKVQEWQETFDAIGDCVTIHDTSFNVLLANKACGVLLGTTPDKIRSRKCFELFHSLGEPVDGCPMRTALQTGHSSDIERFEPLFNRWFSVSCFPLHGKDGAVRGVVHYAKDITERKKLEEQLLQSQKMEAVGTLAGGIAHDFNNILMAITGYGSLALMKMTADDPQRKNVEQMLEAANRAAHLTKDLLLFSKKQVCERKVVDLNETVRKIEKFLSRVIGEEVEFKTILQELPVTVQADDHQIGQVLMNLATNARDAMPGGGRFTVTTEQILLDKEFSTAHGYGKPGRYALLTASDTGKGIDTETQKQIFDPFFTTKEVGKGTGLGLAVAYGIIKQHEGYINVYSEPGIGTTFRIYLPLAGRAADGVKEDCQGNTAVRGTETILLAEDNDMVRSMVKDVLTEFGYTVVVATDGESAIRKFNAGNGSIQLLLLDLIMPKKNGKEAFDEINKLQPGIKVIFISGYAPDFVLQQTAPDQEIHLINKPISPNLLLQKVRSVLDE
ncbi:MAG: response regulator [Geobacter sp.]|nr:response regulator [Geobacter sp.]